MGLGYIGLPTAAVIASRGIEVTGVDVNPEVVRTVAQGKIHIIEPELDKLVKEVVEKGCLKAASRPERADAFFIVVPTPFKENHAADISYVEAATRMVIPFLVEGNLFIIESTSPVMTTEKMAEIIFAERPELKDNIYISYCPERVLPGNVLYELEHNDRVIGGLNPESADKAAEFYARFVKGRLHKTNARTAEMCKLTENASRDVEIAFANELSIICEQAGIDVWDLIDLANKHPRVDILRPGCGVGGHCIAVDPWFIASDFPREARIIRKAREINDGKADWCVNKALRAREDFVRRHDRQPVIACMGMAFKPDIDDLRESPAVYIISRIAGENPEETLIAEPNIKRHKTFKLSPWQEAYKKADIVVWLVRHREFAASLRDPGKIELDFCGVRRREAEG
jgi:UDP-N-acetyl-D-mannosaminuronic acid dehydrogenase